MASASVWEFTDGNFESEVLTSPTPVLVDFWAEWCQPCRMMGPEIDAVAAAVGESAKVGKMDIDKNHGTAGSFNITAIPTVIIFKGGKVHKKFVGMRKRDELLAAVREAMSA